MRAHRDYYYYVLRFLISRIRATIVKRRQTNGRQITYEMHFGQHNQRRWRLIHFDSNYRLANKTHEMEIKHKTILKDK